MGLKKDAIYDALLYYYDLHVDPLEPLHGPPG